MKDNIHSLNVNHELKVIEHLKSLEYVVESYNSLFKMSVMLAKVSAAICFVFMLFLSFYTIRVYNYRDSFQVIRQSNNSIFQVLSGNEKFWYDESNRQLQLRDKKKGQ